MKVAFKAPLEKITKVRLPFDRRHADPKQNYGIHATDVWFILRGESGAVQFGVTLPAYLPHVFEELRRKEPHYDGLWKIRGFDVGYHSKVPVYEGQQPMACDLLDCPCYYDGSSLRADDWVRDIFSVTGEHPEKLLWKMLEDEYELRFGK